MKRVIFVGQAMPRHKEELNDWPSLNAWLFSIGISYEEIVANFFYTALVDYFPGAKGGSHLVPTEDEIIKERPRLQKAILDFNPDIVVPIGRLSIAYCFNEKIKPLTHYIGKSFVANPYGLLKKELIIIPLPHPSGASTWYHKQEHKALLQKALETLKKNI